MSPRLLPLILFLSALPCPAREEPPRDHKITVADYATVATMITPAVSPDGKAIVYVDSRWDLASDRRNADLWLAAVDGSPPRRLTFDPAADTAPTWGPAGRWIYFRSNRRRPGAQRPPHDGTTQVWRIAPTGLHLQPVTRISGGLEAYELEPGAQRLYYTVHTSKPQKEWADLVRRHQGRVKVRPAARRTSRIHRLDLRTWRDEIILDRGRYIRNLALAPDGNRLALHTCPDERLLTNEGWSRVDVLDLATGKVTVLPDSLYRRQAESPYGWIQDLAWAPDSQALAFTVGWDGYPDEILVADLTGRKPQLRRLTRPDDGVNVAGALAWRPGSRDLCFLGDWHALQHVYCIQGVMNRTQGDYKVLAAGNRVVTDFDFLPDGKGLAVIASAPDHGRDLFLAAGPNDYIRLTDINPQMARWQLPEISLFNWQGADGDRVEGVLEVPYGYDRAKDGPLPLIVELHGGPTASTKMGLRFWCYGRTIMAARGYALFSPNYHGSTGYGDAFLKKLIGRENDIEVTDILTGVDALVAAGIADPKRLGIMGWSNGGFLVNAVITRSNRFKAASSGAGVVSQLLQWAVEDTPGHVINYMQGLPWNRASHYLKGSPIFALHKCTTPTLIHCGEEDPRVPLEHSLTLYRGLHDYLKVPTVLLTYPGQGHGLGTCSMRKAKMEWDLAWFDKYILGR